MTRFGVPGQNTAPLAYADGRMAVVPMIQAKRAPLVTDKKYPMWTEWRVGKDSTDSAPEGDFYKLVKFESNGDATWVKFTGSASGPIISLSDDASTKVLSDVTGNVQLEGVSGQIVVTSDAGNNKLTFGLAGGGTAADQFTTDDANIVLPDGAGNVNVIGLGETSTEGNVANTVGILSPRTAQFIVDGGANLGTHTTIAGAMADAVTGDTIFIRPGVYTEDVTLKAGVNLTSFIFEGQDGQVKIEGKLSASFTGSCVISGIRLSTNGDYFLEVTGANATFIFLECCYLEAADNTGMLLNAASCVIDLDKCDGDILTTGITMWVVTTGKLEIRRCRFTNTGVSTTPSTYAGSGVNGIHYSSMSHAISVDGSTFLGMTYSGMDCGAINSTALTVTTGGNASAGYSSFSSGTASCITATTTCNLRECRINSSNAAAIDGAGTLKYTMLSFTGTSSAITTTTQTLEKIGPNAEYSGTSHLTLPTGTTAQRPGTPATGMWRMNTTTLRPEIYESTVWLAQVGQKVSWTPVLRFGAATTGITYSSAVGEYTRIGNIIQFNGEFTLTSKGSATGDMDITGLDIFNPTWTTAISFNSSALTFTNFLNARITNSGNIQFINYTTGSVVTRLTDTAFANGTNLRFAGTFTV
jgi:hypothetical protein